MSAETLRIANTISNLRDNLAGMSTFLVVLNSMDYAAILTACGLDPGSTVNFGRKDGSLYTSLDAHKSIQRIKSNPQFNLDYVGVYLMAAISLVADALSHHKNLPRTPELEFLRHIRNGISHGNSFHFRNGEPKQPASFRSFKITRAVEGMRPLWEFLSPGDVLDLLDEVENQLRALP